MIRLPCEVTFHGTPFFVYSLLVISWKASTLPQCIRQNHRITGLQGTWASCLPATIQCRPLSLTSLSGGYFSAVPTNFELLGLERSSKLAEHHYTPCALSRPMGGGHCDPQKPTSAFASPCRNPAGFKGLRLGNQTQPLHSFAKLPQR